MRASANSAAGSSGQDFVAFQFQELGWGVAPNHVHDLGTDLWLMARDANRWDLGALVGAQVKNWMLDFENPTTVDGVQGWWFSEKAKHFDYWLDHRVPHILVCVDKTTRTSYWVHVTQDAVVSTGKGRKIFVPEAQKVEAAGLDALVRVALSRPVGVTWEGSAWVTGQALPEGARHRYGMLVPRLVAPHPNVTPSTISAAEALALLVSYRIGEAQQMWSNIEPRLDAKVAVSSDDPEWQFYAAVFDWVVGGSLEALEQFTSGVDAVELRVAHLAALSAALFEEGEHARAAVRLREALARWGDIGPVDRAWLSLHLARQVVELGDLVEAKTLAFASAVIGDIAPSDPTAKAVSGTAAELIFTLSGWNRDQLGRTVQARDNFASWWRAQTMVSGLADHLEASFSTWAGDRSVTFGASDQTWQRLRAATLISGLGADGAGWKYAASLLARYVLLKEPEAAYVESAIDLLRRSGASKPLKLLIERSLREGPMDGLLLVLPKLDLSSSSRSSLWSDLEIVRGASDLMDSATADRSTRWLLSELSEPEATVARLKPRFIYVPRLVEVLASLYLPNSLAARAEVREHLTSLPLVTDQVIAHNYARLMHSVALEDWTPSQVEALVKRPEGDHFELARAVELVLVRHDPSRREGLIERIANGDVQALALWGDVSELPSEAAANMIEKSSADVRSVIASARSGMQAFGFLNALERLILLNVFYPEAADWEPCVEAFAEPEMGANELAPGL